MTTEEKIFEKLSEIAADVKKIREFMHMEKERRDREQVEANRPKPLGSK